MPLKGVRYRMTSHNVRLAFRGGSAKKRTGRVVEAKNMKTGAVHTPAEFKADRASRKRRNNPYHRRNYATHRSSNPGNPGHNPGPKKHTSGY